MSYPRTTKLKNPGQVLCLRAGRLPTLLGLWGGVGGAASGIFPWSCRTPSASLRQQRWVRLLLTAPYVHGSSPFSSRWLGTKYQGPEQRDLYAAPSPCAGSWALFSFHPMRPGFNGQKLCPLPHCRDTNVHSPQGLPRHSTVQGERPGLLQRADCELGPQEQAGSGQQQQ